MNKDFQIINLTPENIAEYGVCGYKDVKKHKELRNKIDWFKEYYPKGLRIKALILEDGSYQGMLEYIPGEFAHRPVNAKNYQFIHCVFVGFKKEFKQKGYASALLKECIEEAKASSMKGVAVVSRKGSFMCDNKIFLKHGFEVVDKAMPDFQLLALRFNERSSLPSFKNHISDLAPIKEEGLIIMRSVQCPYTEKNVNAILKTAKQKYNLSAQLIDLKDSVAVQKSPCAFGSFCILYNGEIITHHPISNKRFENIMNKIIN
ncbi:GNAT family N-acetyltransferase [Marinifilum caeruleilacunae]|uniref:GNAT family N-acetyltransferase n=1 Tax=Marinifilum caeruleilacunae TaxID=2499076 RepID=A0ABX1WV54_9BACT|nr:GNAT family N-acetyltransferase [Marinifilum caeruleilacunae]NOU59836.1 GNAT family N-acetyltransferase [Marinifilum caeruleilacunae]